MVIPESLLHLATRSDSRHHPLQERLRVVVRLPVLDDGVTEDGSTGVQLW